MLLGWARARLGSLTLYRSIKILQLCSICSSGPLSLSPEVVSCYETSTLWGLPSLVMFCYVIFTCSIGHEADTAASVQLVARTKQNIANERTPQIVVEFHGEGSTLCLRAGPEATISSVSHSR